MKERLHGSALGIVLSRETSSSKAKDARSDHSAHSTIPHFVDTPLDRIQPYPLPYVVNVRNNASIMSKGSGRWLNNGDVGRSTCRRTRPISIRSNRAIHQRKPESEGMMTTYLVRDMGGYTVILSPYIHLLRRQETLLHIGLHPPQQKRRQNHMKRLHHFTTLILLPLLATRTRGYKRVEIQLVD
jgi:hypothetical protein